MATASQSTSVRQVKVQPGIEATAWKWMRYSAFLLIPLVYGRDIPGAIAASGKTDTSDAIAFYKAFAMTAVKMNATDDLDVNDPHTLTLIRDREMTLLDIMQHSAAHDMVAREWVTGFPLVRRGADLLRELGPGRQAIVDSFLTLLATEPDTFITTTW